MAQVDSNHYLKPEYLSPERLASLSYQFSEITSKSPNKILEVGIGQGLLTYLLRAARLSVTTFDFDENLSPDIIGDVRKTMLPNGSFDLVCCYQVLEHLPYEDFGTALNEINRITRQYALISLPHAGYYFQYGFKLPKIGNHLKVFSLPVPSFFPHKFDGEHYWEIGKRDYPLQRILISMKKASFKILKSYRMSGNPYHVMFVLEKL